MRNDGAIRRRVADGKDSKKEREFRFADEKLKIRAMSDADMAALQAADNRKGSGRARKKRFDPLLKKQTAFDVRKVVDSLW